jgi:integrase
MIKLRLTKIELHGKAAYRITYPQPDGTRKFRTFTDEAEAKATFEVAEIEHHNHGTAVLTISDKLRSDAIGAFEILTPFNVSLTVAAQFYADHHRRITNSETIENAVSAFLASKEGDASDRYHKDLRNRLDRFVADFPNRKLADFTSGDIQAWLSALSVAALTRNTFWLRLSALWSFAKVQGWVSDNIVAEIPKTKVRGSEIGILAIDELARLLEAASAQTLPYWLLGAFCGCRSAELDRLEWKDVRWESKLLEVPASKSKTASRRFIELRPNLLAWLAPYRAHKGKIAPKTLRKRLETDRENAKLADWKPNCLRHSFASYHLAHFKNANALALEMGHTDADLIFTNYRELVLPSDAAKFWELVPSLAAQKKVVAIV